MITANLAGSTGSHLRAERGHRDSGSHSRLETDSRFNLSEASECEADGGYGHHHQHYHHRESEVEVGSRGEDASASKCSRILRSYKTWGSLACVGLVLVISIVLIILAASGVLSTDSES